MRVIINQLAALGRKTGVGHYSRQLLRGLQQQAGEHQVDGFPGGLIRGACKAFTRARPYLDSAAGGSRPSADGPGVRTATVGYIRRRGRALVGQYFQAVCARERYDLYHEPNFIPFPCDYPTVATLHDLSVLLHPEWHPADRVVYYEQNFHRGLDHCVHFLVPSEFTRQEVIRTLGIAPERITRTYNGVRASLRRLPAQKVKQTLKQLGFPPQYLLYVGTIEPRKNMLRLLRAYCSLPTSLRNRWPLLLVGNWGWTTADVADYFHREARHRGVIHVGYVAEKHLAAIYNGARALLYPSWYEGFGLPPLEMMSCGGAVLASTAGAVVETVGRRAHLIRPGDFDGWRTGMMQALQDKDWWLSLRKGVRALARPFSWDRCAAETLAVYESLCGVRAERWATGDFQEFERIGAAGQKRIRPAGRAPSLRAG